MAARRAQSKSKYKARKISSGSRKSREIAVATPSPVSFSSNLASKMPPLPRWVSRSILVGGLFLLLAIWQRDWVVAAMVNGKPVFGFQVFKQMSKDYRTLAVNKLVEDRIVLDEAAKRNALPSKVEVSAKLAEYEERYGGVEAFEQLLQFQGITREEVERQTRLRLAMEKMFGNEATVSSEEVDGYVLSMEKVPASESAKQRADAEAGIREQKLTEIFAKKLEELKAAAKVRLFI